MKYEPASKSGPIAIIYGATACHILIDLRTVPIRSDGTSFVSEPHMVPDIVSRIIES